MGSYQRIIFDADNTLFDFNQAEQAALLSTLEMFGLPVPENVISIYRRINRELWRQLDNQEIDLQTLKYKRPRLLFKALRRDADIEKHADAFATDYLNELSKNNFLLPGVSETLKQLANTCEMIIVTNGLSRVQRPRLENSNIKQYFKTMVVSEEVGYAKPEAEIFKLACKQAGWSTDERILMVGDNYRADVQGAQAVGINSCWFNLFAKPQKDKDHTYEINHFPELLGIINRSNVLL